MPAYTRLLLALSLGLAPRLATRADSSYQLPAAALQAVVDAPLTPAVFLSPDRVFLLLAERS